MAEKFGNVTLVLNAGVVSASSLEVQEVTFIAHPDNAGTIYIRSSNVLIPVPKSAPITLNGNELNLADITVSGWTNDRLSWVYDT